MRVPFALLLMAVLSTPVVAADTPATGSGKPGGERPTGVCHDDIQKYCGQVKPGEGRIARCMKENEKNFSAACQADMEKHQKQAAEKREEKREACKADVDKFCKDSADGHGGVMRCLHEHEKELSEGCRNSLPKRPPGGRSDGGKPAG